jgi:hypothetical protein
MLEANTCVQRNRSVAMTAAKEDRETEAVAFGGDGHR